jgi:hypothetical protein
MPRLHHLNNNELSHVVVRVVLSHKKPACPFSLSLEDLIFTQYLKTLNLEPLTLNKP